MSLAERAKDRRLALGLTQTEVADRAGVSQQSIEAIESGRTKKPRNILALARVLECDASWLVNGGVLKSMAEINTRRIPLISYVQAGALAQNSEIFSELGEFEYVLTDMDWSENTFALKIEGDSMQPEFKAGDVIIVDPEIEPCPGEFVVAKNGDNEATFKKYRPQAISVNGVPVFELVPLNPDYPAIRSDMVPVTIIGTMVEHRIYRRKR
ncbi:TPA: helix-turn-helix domain-containing protein [Yersinia enterocolitica]|uniref:LexA family protein n=1 Tax=Yersinia sp. LJYL362 TaxID=3402108 RepID=UPI0032F33377|nr:helix-turn-helix domain-containing protein [Yersinia enterocolitica]HDL7382179.1 helix-turn-helix domain-containing protein [Yersinia enterocolitica]HDL7454773.1 helix-turn-helix domain-containing protein [Yersinia enterocolitica]